MTTHDRDKVIAAAKEAEFSEKQWAVMVYLSGPYEIATPTNSFKRLYAIAHDDGRVSRDAEVAELRNELADALDCKSGTGPTALSMVVQERDNLREQVTLLRDALRHLWNERTPDSLDEVGEALAATDPGRTRQDKAAIFKSLGLVPWDNKPPACTDMVWIEPGKIDAKVAKAPK